MYVTYISLFLKVKFIPEQRYFNVTVPVHHHHFYSSHHYSNSANSVTYSGVVLEQSGELVQYEKCTTYFGRFNHCSVETVHLIISTASVSTCMAYIKYNLNIPVRNRVWITPTPPKKHPNYAIKAVDFPTFCSEFLKLNYQQQSALRCSCHSVH